jgi:hypothetical protein
MKCPKQLLNPLVFVGCIPSCRQASAPSSSKAPSFFGPQQQQDDDGRVRVGRRVRLEPACVSCEGLGRLACSPLGPSLLLLPQYNCVALCVCNGATAVREFRGPLKNSEPSDLETLGRGGGSAMRSVRCLRRGLHVRALSTSGTPVLCRTADEAVEGWVNPGRRDRWCWKIGTGISPPVSCCCCLSVCFLLHVHVHRCTTRTHVHTYTRTHVHTYTRTHVHTYTRTHVHTYTRTHVYTCVLPGTCRRHLLCPHGGLFAYAAPTSSMQHESTRAETDSSASHAHGGRSALFVQALPVR